jgi:hypothetical protein
MARTMRPPEPGVNTVSIQSREFLICGRIRVPVDADDHVDAADGGPRRRLRQARDGDMLARNVEQPAGILEKGSD